MANQPKKYKKFVATAATATLVASAIVPVASAASLSDIAGNTHEEAITSLVDAGVINGYPDGTFQPNKTLTRSDVVKLLGKYLVSKGLEVPADYKTNVRFNDLTSASNDELLKYAAVVYDAGVFNGSNGNLLAGDNITRENMAVVLVRAFDTLNNIDLVSYVQGQEYKKDVKDLYTAKSEARSAIEVLDFFDITNPAVANFNPKGSTTRGQFATFLYKTINTDFSAVTGVANSAVSEIKAVNNTTVEVTFKETVGNIEALDFTIDGLEVKNAVVKQTDAKTVVLTTAAQTGETVYTLNVNAAKAGTFKGVSAVIPTAVTMTTQSVQGKLGQQVTVKAQVTVAEGQSKAGIPVTFSVPGNNNDAVYPTVTGEAVTNAEGVATFTYTRYGAGTDSVTAYATGDRSKFSTGYVFWGVEQILAVEEVTTGSTINNNANKTYKVTYKHPTTGKVVANKELNVSLIENINVAPNVAKNATVNGVAVQQLTNNTAPKTAVITTDSKGEATFTVSGANTEVTPVVFDLNTDRTYGTEYASYYEADLLQVTAPKVKFSALQAEYSIELTRDGGENAAFGHTNGRKYKVLVKDKDGKVAKNEIVNVAFNEDLDRVISTNTNAKFVEIDADGRQVGFYDTTPKNGNTEDKITVKTNDKGEASFVIGSQSGNTNDYATPVAWIDINSSNAKDGQLDEGEPTKVGQISYFEAAKLTGGKLVSTDSNGDAEDQFEGNETAYFEFQLTNQSGKKIAIGDTGGYDVITATYTLTNDGDQDVVVVSTVNNRIVEQTVSPNRDYTVTVDASASPRIAVKPANSEKSASVKVTANAIVKDTDTNGLKQFTINSTSETKVSFKGTKEVGNLEKGIIYSFNTDKQTFTIAGKNPVKYAGESGKTYIYRDLDNRPVSLENFEKELEDAAKSSNPAYGVEITYEVKENEITFYLKKLSGSAPIDEVNAAESALETAKAGLAAAIKAANDANLVEAEYTPTTWEVYTKALAAAKAVDVTTATKASIEKATKDLTDAKAALVKKAEEAQAAVDAVAAGITSAPAITDGKLELPKVDGGYTVAMADSSNEAVIALDGTVTNQPTETIVAVTYTVTSEDGKYKANTSKIYVTVPKTDTP